MKKTNSTNKCALRSRSLKFETLESRELLAVDATSALTSSILMDNSSVETGLYSNSAATNDWYDLTSSNLNPSNIDQELLEQTNRFRTDPQGEVERIFSVATNEELIARNSLVNMAISLTSYPRDSIGAFLEEMRSITPTPPLAFNSSLASAAAAHTSYMKMRNDISHQCVGEDPLDKRLLKAGFQHGIDGSGGLYGENIGGSFFEQNGFSVASYMQAAFVVDWGIPAHTHRDTIVNPVYTEIGISVQSTPKSVGPYLVTCDFGRSVEGVRTDGAYLLGVVLDDLDNDRFYDVGEGLGNISILIERINGTGTPESVTISSWSSGGYQIFLVNGSYRVTVSGDGFNTSVTKSVTISDGTNAKLDFFTSDAGAAIPVIDLNGEAEGRDWSVVYVEGSAEPLEVFASSKLTVTDEDSAYLYGAKITLSERPDGVKESLDLSVGSSSITASFDEQSGRITLEGAGTIEEYENVIASLTYFNESELCTLTNHTIVLSVYDGNNWSEEAVLTVSIQPTNLPNMTVHELVVYEGDEGTKAVNFLVELDAPARLDVSFNFNVALGGTAVEGEEFVISKGDPIVIASGESSATIDCYIVGNYNPLKPEGLKRIEEGYENPSTNFFLEIVELENAYLTNENSLAKATIYDDDSPIILGETDKYSFDSVLSTDNGQRRYVFSLVPVTSGLFTWNADSLGLPEGTIVSVRETGLESEPIAVSKSTLSGCNVQWFADPSVEYWITIEADADFNSIAVRLLPITDEKVVLVDPIFDNADTNLLQLMWEDEDVQLGVGDLFWDFYAGYWDGVSLKTNRNDLDFALTLAPFSQNIATSNGETTDFSLDERGSLSTTGFAAFKFYGKTENEKLTFSGTSGNDYLYYSNGVGYFQCSDGNMYSFDSVNNIVVDGMGGVDRAFIEDTPSNDRLETNNDLLALYGGGFSLTAKRFSNVRAVFNKGGEDSYFAFDHGDDVEAHISNSSAIISGTFEVTDPANEVGGLPEAGSENLFPYVRTVAGIEHINLAPEDTIGSVVLHGDNSIGAYVDIQVGNLTAYNKRAETTTSVSRAKSLTISGLNPILDERFTVNMPSTYQSREEGNLLVVEDMASGWTMKIPLWKEVETTPDISGSLLENKESEKKEYTSASLSNESNGSDSILDVFSTWNNEETNDYDLDSIVTNTFIPQETNNVFLLAHSLKDNDWNVSKKKRSIFQ